MKRFAHYVGQRCRQATIKDIAEELKLDWDTVKMLEKQYMQAQLARAGRPGPILALLGSIEGTDAAVVVATHDPSVARQMEVTWLMDHGQLQTPAASP